jgi:hypothetical protein
LGDYQGIAIHEEESMLVAHVFGGKQDICQDGIVILDAEPFIFVCPTKGTLVMRAPKRHLQEDTHCFARGPNDSSFVVHSFGIMHVLLSSFVSSKLSAVSVQLLEERKTKSATSRDYSSWLIFLTADS